MKKTKIICTMGPNTGDRELLKALALNGMDIARFNFSHGDYEEQKGRLDLLKSVREELDIPIKYIGVGEQIDDLRPFDPVEFANALFQNTEDKDRNEQEEA